jgi:hypothetical protein
METQSLRLAPALFLASGACFLLPFAHINNFGDPHSATLTGFQLLLGASVPYMEIKPDPYATVALFSTIIGFLVSLFPGVKNLVCSALVAIPGAFSLFVMTSSSEAEFEPACYMMLFLLAASAIYGLISAYLLLRPALPSPLPPAK